MPGLSRLDDRELRLRIARLRRRIDGRLHAVARQGRTLLSWRAVVRRHPGYSAMAAAGAGLSLAAGLRKGRLVGWLGRRLVQAAVGRLAGQFWQDLRQVLGRGS
jgi:carbon monoxide dehydrogenase subunit G